MMANDLAAFFAGLLSPLLTPTHALALVGLGLLISQQDRRLFPQATFALAVSAGLLALVDAVGETPASEVLLAGAAISGVLVAAGFPLPFWLIGALATVIGVAVGLDSPPEVISLEEAAAMLVGTLTGAVLALALLAAVASRTVRDWQKIAVRVLGSWASASALLALAVRFAAK
jgi:urease accessory protein